jgi:RNA polymerase subunit RPABC4/transcription elongation factor Spt4
MNDIKIDRRPIKDKQRYCIHCGKEMELYTETCPHCGKPVEKQSALRKNTPCYFCDTLVSDDAAYCPICGHKVARKYDELSPEGRKHRNKSVMDLSMKGAIAGVVIIMILYAFFFGGIRLSTFVWCTVYGALCFILGGSGQDKGKYWDGTVTDMYAVRRRHLTFSPDKTAHNARRLRLEPYYHHVTHVQRESDGRCFRFDELVPKIYNQLNNGDQVRFHKGIRTFEVLKKAKNSPPPTIEKFFKPRKSNAKPKPKKGWN